MGLRKALFDDYVYCEECKKLMPKDYEFDICPACMEYNLFKKVREYIRESEVTEYDVAEAFEIPLRQVRGWIREGRIQYKEDSERKLIGRHCARCGEIILKGQYCINCKNILKHQKVTLVFQPTEGEESKIRYLDVLNEEE